MKSFTLLFLAIFFLIKPASANEIEIISDYLEVHIDSNKAIFTKKVNVKKGILQINADNLVVTYDGKKIENMTFSNNVIINNGHEQAYGDKAEHITKKSILTLEGNVKLLQNKNTILGEKFIYNFKTKQSKVIGKTSNNTNNSKVKIKFYEDFK